MLSTLEIKKKVLQKDGSVNFHPSYKPHEYNDVSTKDYAQQPRVRAGSVSTSGGVYEPNFHDFNYFEMTLDTNAIINNPTEVFSGQRGEFTVIRNPQDGFTVDFGNAYVQIGDTIDFDSATSAVLNFEYTVIEPELILLEYTKPKDAYISTWRTTSANENITINLSGDINALISWGDGEFTRATSTGDASHIYSVAGDHQVEVTGKVEQLKMPITSRPKIVSVENLGSLDYRSFYEAFYYSDMISFDCGTHDMSKVTTTYRMFQDCRKMTHLGVANLDMSNVTDAYYMMDHCWSVTHFEIADWDVSKIWRFHGILRETRAASLDVSKWDTSSATNMRAMFDKLYTYTTTIVGGLANFDTSKVETFKYMFEYSDVIDGLDVSNWDVSSCWDFGAMFQRCGKLSYLDVSKWDTSSATDMGATNTGGMFGNCSILSGLDVSGFDTSKVTTMGLTFQNCKALTTIDVSGWDTSNVTMMASLFSGCTTVTALDVSGFNTPKVTNMSLMFNGCPLITSLDLTGFDTSLVTTTETMFNGCTALTCLTNIDTTPVTTKTNMFAGCAALVQPDGWNADPLLYTGECLNITDADGANWTNGSACP